MKQQLLVGSLALTLTACAAADDGAPNTEPRAKKSSTEKSVTEEMNTTTAPAELNAESATLWLPSPDDGVTYIPVCWVSPDSGKLKEAVRQAVFNTWEKAARVTFTGWEDCQGSSDGIRIKINDEQPHTKGIGRQLAGAKTGMVLNFTFQNWDLIDSKTKLPTHFCKNNPEYCVAAIGVHEFGHALGFPHEQDRSDVPTAECKGMRQDGEQGDALLGTFDWDSIMNYCNGRWNNDGQLSPTDREQVANVYGGVIEIDDPSFACFIPPCPTVPGYVDGGEGLLHFGDLVALGDATGHYLRMDDDEDVRSSAPHFKDEERWVLINPDNPSDRGALTYGARVSLQGQTGAYMTARSDLSVRSWGQIGGEWEIWTIEHSGAPMGDYVDVTDPIVLHSGVVDGYLYHDFGNPRLTHNIGNGEVWYMRGPL